LHRIEQRIDVKTTQLEINDEQLIDRIHWFYRWGLDADNKGCFKLIQSVEELNKAITDQQEIEIRLMNKNDEMKYESEKKEEE